MSKNFFPPQWQDGTSQVMPVDNLKVELKYYYCRQAEACLHSCTIPASLANLEQSWIMVATTVVPLSIASKTVWDKKKCGVMWGKGCAIFCFLQPLLLDGVPHLQPEAMWDDRDFKKKRFTCQASAYTPNTPWRILCHCVYQGQLNQSAETSLLK